jgi:Fic family protein
VAFDEIARHGISAAENNPMTSSQTRAGYYVPQPGGYRSFIPEQLPPKPPIAFDARRAALLSRADQALGRLDGVIQTMPNPDLFVAMYVRTEAVLSSQIEGTQSTLQDLLAVELEPQLADLAKDVDEIVNYVSAMKHGLDRLTELPLSLRLIREIHAELLRSVRGSNRQSGEFRKVQNFIGPAGVRDIRDATFVPPPVPQMLIALGDFEKFLHDPGDLPPLVHVGLAHAQFETIHPFIDGNGRVGRLLITFLLVHHDVLHQPVLYLSVYLRRNCDEYYDRLMMIRDDGDWEGWLDFFLRGVAETSEEATMTARRIVQLREDERARLQEHGLGGNALRLLDLLFDRPLVNVKLVKDRLGVSFATASKLIERAEDLAIVREITGRKRDRLFRHEPYLKLFLDAERPSSQTEVQITEAEAR